MKTRHKTLTFLIVLGVIGIAVLFETDYLYIPTLPPENLDDIEIILERTACYGTCPIYSVTIDGDGNVTYEGTQFVKTLGVQMYNIPQSSVEELVALVYQTNYFSLNDRYEFSATDLPTVITTVRIGDDTKTVENYGGAGPDRLSDVEAKIDELTDSESLWKD